MRTKDSFFEQDTNETDLSFEEILYDAYQRCGEIEGVKRPEQDKRIKDKTRLFSICKQKTGRIVDILSALL